MKPHQKFRLGNQVESIAVRQAGDGTYYSELTDIQDTFPNALKFKIDGVTLVYLQDKHGNRYNPLRIEHCPDDVIDIVVDPLAHGPVFISTTFINQYASSTTANPAQPEPYFADVVQQSTAALTVAPNTTIYAASSSTDNHLNHNPLTTLDTIAKTAMQTLQMVQHSATQNAANHQEMMAPLIRTFEHTTQVLQHTNQLLQGQENARIRDEEMHRMQQQTIDRLVATQERVDALLIQNYELHEYPIPRRFIILPDSYNTLDPRRVVSQRYRLYFLCECGEHCSADADNVESPGSIPIKNQVHLANHEGYELTRPTEFYSRYGPYILGLLRILKHCLAVTAVAAPAVFLAHNQVGSVMQGVESVAKNTMELAINSSINFLEQRLENSEAAENVANLQQMQSGDGATDIISDLKMLEGADLRRLDTFLRNKDKDKILGNLYRIVTTKGHVKWVCLKHYQASYRVSAMKAFIQTVETTGGTYDPHLGKVTITLKSGTVSKNFFTNLVDQALAVTELDVALNWSFGSSDLSHLVKKLAQSNVMALRLNLMDDSNALTGLAPGIDYIPKYRPLIKLFSSNTLQRLDLVGADSFGNKTPSLSKDQQDLRSLHVYGSTGDLIAKFVDFVQACPLIPSMTDVVFIDVPDLHRGIPDIIRASSAILQVLVLAVSSPTNEPSDLSVFRPDLSYSKLTHLHLALDLTTSSLQQLALVLPTLSLIHFGADHRSKGLLPYVNFTSLRSLSLDGMDKTDLNPIFEAFLVKRQPCQLETMTLALIGNIGRLPDLLRAIRLKQLYLFRLGSGALRKILRALNLCELTVLNILDTGYDWFTEENIATRNQEFTDQLRLYLGRPQLKEADIRFLENVVEKILKGVYSEKSRTLQGSSTKLPRSRVHLLEPSLVVKQSWQSILPNVYP
ncbi:hypothetical protein BG015_007974 [Linnemannia schmuckeri]|uniref:Uncharacterized protein n=1 Tax=Linnemannia schmuckeri TaxID=64567 RepID=A0A9P5S675_9FUNG|nr:hypothetical protein BG015_007974 [Linnemannia schmuckeri]